jgi:tubulin polyglutamylase TTLL4
MFSEGLVRLATQPYSTSKGSLKKRFIHLTNFSINKKADNYKKNVGESGVIGDSSSTAPDTEEGETPMSSKWSLEQLRKEYEKMGISYEEVFKDVKTLCIKTLMAVEPQITTAMRATKHRAQCFEVYGFDVLIDAKLRPWLLEVNVAPSLSSSSPYDKQVKTMLLCDTLHLVGFRIFNRKLVEDDKKKENKHRLLGFEAIKRTQSKESKETDDGDVKGLKLSDKPISSGSPLKSKH